MIFLLGLATRITEILAQVCINTVLENQNKPAVDWFSHIISIFQPLHPDYM